MNKIFFVTNIVNGQIRLDTQRLLNVKPQRYAVGGNINYPLALYVLSCMEFLGSILLGEDINYTENVSAYINTCFVNANEYNINLIRDIYRHGLAHEYFARGGVSRSGVRPAIRKGINFAIILDAETLANDFLSSLKTFENSIVDQKYEKRMSDILKKVQGNINKHKSLIDNLTQEIPYANATPSSPPPEIDDDRDPYTTRLPITF